MLFADQFEIKTLIIHFTWLSKLILNIKKGLRMKNSNTFQPLRPLTQ